MIEIRDLGAMAPFGAERNNFRRIRIALNSHTHLCSWRSFWPFFVAVFLVLAQPAVGQTPDDQGIDEVVTSESASEEPELPEWLTLDVEHRTRTLLIDPLDLSGTSIRDVFWTEQRGRVDLQLSYEGIGRIRMQLDLLDGVLFGDNGVFGGDPSTNSGVSLVVRRPNRTIWEVGLPEDADPLDTDSYAPVLREIEPIDINFLYGEAILPFGMLRAGRQPMTLDYNLATHDGGRHNRWGVSQYSDAADRIMIATKLDEIIELIGGDDEIDPSMDEGVFLAFSYDWLTQGQTLSGSDDTNQFITTLLWRTKDMDWFGWDWEYFRFFFNMTHVTNTRFQTDLWAIPTRVDFAVGPFAFNLLFGLNVGSTREISEGFAGLSNQEPVEQDLVAGGVELVLDLRLGPVLLTMQFDYASGDGDPRSSNDLTTFSHARDLNVGLLLFEHILAFESARSAAVGIENLSSLGFESFPITEVETDGRFSNAIGMFPQVAVDVVDNLDHHFLTRFGVLMAWAEAGAVDPIVSVLNMDGGEISDDLVNYHGGAPGNYYGTELDLQLQWTYHDFFIWTVEGAALFPGSALEDEHGDAVPSFLLENRFFFAF